MRIYPLTAGLGIAFLLETLQGLYLIDCGSPGQQSVVLNKMKALGRTDLKLIWITHAHYDHYGSAAALHELTGARIGVHPADAASLALGKSPLGTTRGRGLFFSLAQPILNLAWPLPACPVDFTIEDGETLERFGLDASILHTPGHTPGHSCVVLEDGTAFAADLIGGSRPPRLQKLLATNWGQLPISLAHLQAAQPKWVFTGHSGRAFPGHLLQDIPL